TVAEDLKVEVLRGSRSPEAERIDVPSAVTHHGTIEGEADQRRRLAGIGAKTTAAHLKRTVQLDLHGLARPGDLPRIPVPEPVVRLFLRPAVLDGLLEDAVLVTKAVALGGELHGGHRIQEAGRKPPQPAVSQARVRLLLQQFEPIEI